MLARMDTMETVKSVFLVGARKVTVLKTKSAYRRLLQGVNAKMAFDSIVLLFVLMSTNAKKQSAMTMLNV